MTFVFDKIKEIVVYLVFWSQPHPRFVCSSIVIVGFGHFYIIAEFDNFTFFQFFDRWSKTQLKKGKTNRSCLLNMSVLFRKKHRNDFLNLLFDSNLFFAVLFPVETLLDFECAKYFSARALQRSAGVTIFVKVCFPTIHELLDVLYH